MFWRAAAGLGDLFVRRLAVPAGLDGQLFGQLPIARIFTGCLRSGMRPLSLQRGRVDRGAGVELFEIARFTMWNRRSKLKFEKPRFGKRRKIGVWPPS
jgi:hypothetical protein